MKFLLLAFIFMIPGVCRPAVQANVVATRLEFAGLKTALDAFAVDCGRYPTTSEGLTALIHCPTNISGRRWRGPYFNEVQDLWHHDYVYRCPGIHNTNAFDIYSCGFDGISKHGGEDPDDINNWDPSSPHGGNDFALNYRQLLQLRFDNSPTFRLLLMIFNVIVIIVGVRLVDSLFSPRGRALVVKYPIAHTIWFLFSVAMILISLDFFLHPLFPLVGR